MAMVRLHLVGFTPDHKGLVFSGRRGGRSGTYWVPVDDSFAKAIIRLEETREEAARAKVRGTRTTAKPPAGRSAKSAKDGAASGRKLSIADYMRSPSVTDTQDLPLPPQSARVQSKLSPREIQQLLREGRPVKDVAAEAGVEIAWVDRFLGPVVEEMTGIVAMTRRSYQSRPRLGQSGLSIGEAVRRNLEDRKASTPTIEQLEHGWDARRVKPRTWRVRLRFTHRGKRRVAEWEFRTDTRTARPRNKLATELGWWPDGPGVRTHELLSAIPAVRAEGDLAGEAAVAASETGVARPRRTPAKRSSAKRTPAKRSSARRAPSKRSTAKRTPAKRTAPKRTTAKAASKRAPSKRRTAGGPSARRKR
jgi:hypothetical protein